MRGRKLSVPLALLLLVAVVGPAAAMPPTPLTSLPQDSENVRVSGQYVIWAQDVDPSETAQYDIYAMNLTDQQPFLVAGGDANQYPAAIDDGIVVWTEIHRGEERDRPDVRGKNLVTGQDFDIATMDGEGQALDISDGRVIWSISDGTIMLRDLTTGADPVVLLPPPDNSGLPPGVPGWDRTPADLEGNWLVWLEIRRGLPNGGTRYYSRLFALELDGGQPTLIDEMTGMAPDDYLNADLGGDTVIYSSRSNPTLTALNLATGERRAIVTVPGPQDGPVDAATDDGRYVFWRNSVASLSNGEPTDILGYDLATGSRFVVVGNGHYSTLSAAGGLLAWRQWETLPTYTDLGTSRITVASIADILPSAPRPDPRATSSDWTYFPETGHYLAFGFKAFWERSGGLPVFGYPLTEEFDEPNPDSGQVLTVQYLERQRFEYHPEHAGSAYEVELGRLGAAEAARRGLLATAPFQPLPPETGSDTACTFVPETGHRLCHGFRAYWAGHGLELGDPGLTERESLALFGYPLSEEFVDPATGRVTQYFERARFEYHPDNPEPYRILLGRLGAEELVTKGW